jgi:hypothetical protein
VRVLSLDPSCAELGPGPINPHALGKFKVPTQQSRLLSFEQARKKIRNINKKKGSFFLFFFSRKHSTD